MIVPNGNTLNIQGLTCLGDFCDQSQISPISEVRKGFGIIKNNKFEGIDAL